MTTLPKPGAVLFAKDISRVAAFYQALAGLEATYRDDSVVVLESEHQQLVVHALPEPFARSIQIASPPERRDDNAVKLVFPVRSVSEARDRAAQLGGELNREAAEFEFRGFRACDGVDPEGNVFQLRETVGANREGVPRFDTRALYEALDRQRAERGLSWQDVARETGVSAATMTRTKNGGRLEVDGMLAMVRWLGVPVEHFVRELPR